MNKIDFFLKKMSDVFRITPYPKKDYFDAVSEMEYLDINEVRLSKFQKKMWQEVTIEDMISYGGFIHYLNDSEKKYYYPIYMKYILTQNEELVSRGLDITFLMELEKNDLSYFNDEEKKVILEFILLCIQLNKTIEYKIDDKLLEQIRIKF